MNRLGPGALTLALLPWAMAAHAAPASSPNCAGGAPPFDARPAPEVLAQAGRLIASVLHHPVSVGVAPSLDTYCVTRHGLFVSPTWLPESAFSGGPGADVGYALLAYVAGVDLYQFVASARPAHADADAAGAHGAGCALAVAHVSGEALSLLGAQLRALTTPHGDDEQWTLTFLRGHESCLTP